jgi:hypothetical protein
MIGSLVDLDVMIIRDVPLEVPLPGEWRISAIRLQDIESVKLGLSTSVNAHNSLFPFLNTSTSMSAGSISRSVVTRGPMLLRFLEQLQCFLVPIHGP